MIHDWDVSLKMRTKMKEKKKIKSYTKNRAVRNDRISRLSEHISQFWRQEEKEKRTKVFNI